MPLTPLRPATALKEVPAFFRYGWAVLAVALATLVHAALLPILDASNFAAIIYFPASLLIAWYVGLGPAIVTGLLGGVATAFFFMPDITEATLAGTQQRIGLLLYMAASLVNVWFAWLLETARNAHRRAAKELEDAHQSLRDSAERIQSIVDHVVDGIITIDEHGTIDSMNAAAEAIFGYQAAEIMGKNIALLMPEPYRTEHDQYLKHYLETGERKIIGIGREVKGQRRDGSTFPLDLGVAEFTRQGRKFFTGLIRDITDRRNAEDRVRRSEQLLRQVWESSLDGMRLVDEHGIIKMVNAAYCRMVGLEEDKLVGQSFEIAYAGQQHESLKQTFHSHYPTRTIRAHVSSDLYLHNGKKLQFEASNAFVEVPGQSAWLLSIFRDVTPQRRLEQQFHQAQKMEAIGQLAGGIAHDFNNLLTVINGYSDLLLSMLPESDPSWAPLAEIGRAGQRAAALTRQLLAFSRRQVIQTQVIQLNGVIREAQKLLRRLIGEDISLAAVLDPELSLIRADQGQMEQILLNLAVNARDAMPRGGRLTIETRNVILDERYAQTHLPARQGPHVMLAVTDTGEGMSEEVKRHMFEPFFTTKPVGTGTGLGLATVYGIVKQSSGSIEVYSEPGRGTVFKIYFPQVTTTGDVVPAQPAAPMPRGSETVLLVEDEAPVRTYARLVLEGCGYKVLEAGQGHEALRVAEHATEPIHLLLTDVVMPGGMSGRDLAEQLVSTWPGLKVIFASGYTDDAVVRHGLLSDVVAFLHKPYTPEVLARKVREVLDKEEQSAKAPT